MELKFDVVKSQKFEWGRTINPLKCDCAKCDFLNCPKKNYAVKTKKHIYTVKEFYGQWKDELLKNAKNPYGEKLDFSFTYDMITDLVGDCISFPKGVYWGLGGMSLRTDNITIVTFNRSGKEVLRGEVDHDGRITDYSMTDTQYNLAKRISKAIKEVLEYILKALKEKEPKKSQCEGKFFKMGKPVGWLDRDGKFYQCKMFGHSELAQKLGRTEIQLEEAGWVKIFSFDGSFYCCKRRSEAQTKWLLDNEYIKDENDE